MVKDPGSYKWSSYRTTEGLDKKPDFLNVDWILEQFGADRPQARNEYRRFAMAGLELEPPWKNLKGQCLLGDEAFLGKLSPCSKTKAFSKKSHASSALLIDHPWKKLYLSQEAV
jgi:hypothetical protein